MRQEQVALKPISKIANNIDIMDVLIYLSSFQMSFYLTLLKMTIESIDE